MLDIEQYFGDFVSVLNECVSKPKTKEDLLSAVKILKTAKETKKKVILIGNGGSAAVAEHMAIDFTKNAGLRAITISGSPQLTTFGNDFGYERLFSKGIEAYGDEGDVLIAISSGGTSANILNGIDMIRKLNGKVITFTGFEPGSPVSQKGDINFYVPSKAFGYLELIHNLLIHYLNDALIGSAVYKFR